MAKTLPYLQGPQVDKLVASNPLEALVPEDKLHVLKQLPKNQQHQYLGRMVDGIFKDPTYQTAVSRVANNEFSGLSGMRSGAGDASGVIEQAVEQALRARGL